MVCSYANACASCEAENTLSSFTKETNKITPLICKLVTSDSNRLIRRPKSSLFSFSHFWNGNKHYINKLLSS